MVLINGNLKDGIFFVLICYVFNYEIVGQIKLIVGIFDKVIFFDFLRVLLNQNNFLFLNYVDCDFNDFIYCLKIYIFFRNYSGILIYF